MRSSRSLTPSLRDGSDLGRFPGTTCQATIIQSLRDKCTYFLTAKIKDELCRFHW
jgi:hypothetical protein